MGKMVRVLSSNLNIVEYKYSDKGLQYSSVT